MFKKINSTTLIIILVVLGGIVAFNKFYLANKSESTFNDEFVKIDTAKVTQILIYPKADNGREIKITRQAKGWELQNAQLKTTPNEALVHNLLMSFADLKSLSLAGNDKSSWKQFQVDDSSGTRIKIMTSDNKTYDMVLGKFGYNSTARNGLSYIRRSKEDAVYTVNGFLSLTINKPFNEWRNKTLISGNKDNWSKLSFSYPGDSSFVLARQNGIWTVNNKPADSIKVAHYLGTIANLQGNGMVDIYTPSGAPVYTLTIEGINQTAPITATAYAADSVQKFILHSSLNNDGWFSDGNTRIAERVFVGPKSFF